MTVPAAQNGAAPPDRAALKKRLFALWDKDGDGALKKDELLQLARATGFDGSEEDWAAEYPEMCAEKGCTPEDGLSEAAVMALLDDDSDEGCYFTEQELAEILREAGGAAPAAAAAAAAQAVTAAAPAAAPAAAEGGGGAAATEAAAAEAEVEEVGDPQEMLVTDCSLMPKLNGTYQKTDEFREYLAHDRATYKMEAEGQSYFVYFWNDEEEPESVGWYVASEVGSEEIFATNRKHNDSMIPPGPGDWEVQQEDPAAERKADPKCGFARARKSKASDASRLGAAQDENGSSAKKARPDDRTLLKRRLFKLWDKDGDGALKKDELLMLARATGFDGSEEEWAAEYPEMCAEKGCSTEEGLSRDAVMALLDDESDDGCYFSDQELREILAEAGVSEADMLDVDMEGGEASGGSASSSAGALVAAAQDREALKRKLFRLWDQDKDGVLKEDEMMQVALATGFDGSDEDWHAEYTAMCEEHKCKPEAGLTKATILEMLDDESDQGAFLPTDEIKRLVEVLRDGGPDPEEELEFKVKVVRDGDGKAGFNVRQADLVITGLTKDKELSPMKGGDVVMAVNGEAIHSFAEYTSLAHGVKEFTLTIKRPKEFQEADKWIGVKPGYAFKLGEHGLGYYRDAYDGVHGVMTGVQEFHPAMRFTGEWAGHVFKMGHLGLGYYVDKVSRSYLKRRLFELWDADKDGRLNKHEACQFARDTGFDGTWDEFQKEYDQMCATRSCDPKLGLSETAINDMLEDKTDRGCFLTGDELTQLISKIKKALATSKELADAAAAAGAAVPLAEIPITRLKALAKLHNVSLAGCVEKAEIVEALRKAGVADQGAAAVAAAAERQLGGAGEEGAAARGAYTLTIKLCDESGALKKDSAAKMAACVGWIGDDDAWVEKFTEVYKAHGAEGKEEMSIAAVMAIAEAAKAKLLDEESGAADTGDGKEPAKKKPKFVQPPSKTPVPKKVERKCEACEKDPADLAVVFCTNCKAFLCSKCNEDNHSTKLLKKHKRTNIDGTPVVPVKEYKPLSSLSVGELKALAKSSSTDISACVEKKEIIAALEKGGVKGPEIVTEESKSAEPGAAPGEDKPKAAPKFVAPPPKKKEEKLPEGAIKPGAGRSKAEEESRMQEVYLEHRAKMGPGSQWELLTGVALWRNDHGWERTFFINATTPRGWPNVIEVMEYGERRIKVRGMGIDRNTGTLVGQRWQMGWLELSMIVDKETGELLVQPNTQTGQFFTPQPKKGTGVKVMPRHKTAEEKEKEAASQDPEAGASKPQGLEKKEVFKDGASNEY